MECCRFYQRSCFLFFYQTFALTLKNVFYSIHHIFQTSFQIFVSAILLLLIYAVEYSASKTKGKLSFRIGEIPSDEVIFYEVFNETKNEDCLKIVHEMAIKAGYFHSMDGPHYTVDNYTKCEKNSFCNIIGYDPAYKYEPFHGFPPEGIFKKGGVYNAIGLRCNEDLGIIDFAVVKNISTGSSNPFMVQSSSPKVSLFDSSMTFQKLFYEVLHYHNFQSKLTLDLEYTQFLQSQEAAEGSVNSLINLIIYSIIYLCVFLSTIMLHFKINSERRQNLIYGLTLNGMKESSYWCSWCICESCMLFFSVHIMLVLGIILKYEFFKSVNYFVLFMMVYFFALNQIVYWMFSSTMCSGMLCTVINAFMTAICSSICLQGFMLNIAPVASLASAPVVFLFQLYPAFNLAKLFWDIQLNVTDHKYFAFEDLFSQKLWRDYQVTLPIVPPVVSLLFLVLEALALFLLACYCDVVWPSRWKSARPFYFICSLKYWGLVTGNDRAAVDVVLHDSKKAGSVIPDLDSDIYHEYQKVIKSISEDRSGEKVPLKIVKISKTFTKLFSRRKSAIALTGVNLCADLGSVFVVLGHNGAGKTTLINILNGTLSSSTGDALIFGRSVVTNMDKIRDMTGVCPQFDTVFDSLTVIQHLFLFAALKGLWINTPQIQELMEYLELRKLRNQVASKCSGGEKRRLTFASSVLGNPKIIFLDEPTSGLDPVRKRRVWNYVNKMKKGRVIVLTTHSMEEADKIGDKIAFLALGRIRAVGGADHLKKRFGFGSQLDILLRPQAVSEKNGVSDPIEDFKDQLGEVLRGSGNKVRYQHETGSLLTYVIPHTVRKDEKLKLFRYLEDMKSRGTVKQFGVTPTTLEEVFMNVTHGNADFLGGSLFSDDENDDDEVDGDNREDFVVSVVVEDEIEPFASMEVGRRDSLEDIRKHLGESYQGVLAGEFVFMSKENKDVQILKLQEKNEMARKYSPLIVIRYTSIRNDVQDDDDDTNSEFEEIIEITDENEDNEGRRRVIRRKRRLPQKPSKSIRERVLKKKLEEKEEIIRRQAQEIEMIKREIGFLRGNGENVMSTLLDDVDVKKKEEDDDEEEESEEEKIVDFGDMMELPSVEEEEMGVEKQNMDEVNEISDVINEKETERDGDDEEGGKEGDDDNNNLE